MTKWGSENMLRCIEAGPPRVLVLLYALLFTALLGCPPGAPPPLEPPPPRLGFSPSASAPPGPASVPSTPGQALPPLPGHTARVVAMAFRADGQVLASADQAGVLKLWEVANGRLLWSVGTRGVVNQLVWLPGATSIAGCSAEGGFLWDVATGAARSLLTPKLVPHGRPWVPWLVSPDGKALSFLTEIAVPAPPSVGDATGSIGLFDLGEQRVRASIDPRRTAADLIGWSLDGSALASLSQEGSVDVWETRPPSLRGTCAPCKGKDVKLSPDGSSIASLSTATRAAAPKIEIIDVRTGAVRGVVRAWGKGLVGPNQSTPPEEMRIAFSADSSLAAIQSVVRGFQNDMRAWLRLYDARTWTPMPASREPGVLVCAPGEVHFSPVDTTFLDHGCEDPMLELRDGRTGARLRGFSAPDDGISFPLGALVWSPDGRSFAGTSLERTIVVFDAVTGRMRMHAEGL